MAFKSICVSMFGKKATILTTVISLLFVSSCKFNERPAENSSETPTEETPITITHHEDMKTTLSSLLLEKKQDFLNRASKEKIDAYDEGFEAIRQAGIIDSALNTGDMAPDFSLTNAMGQNVELSEKLKEGPVVLVWYRGGWCPYCNITLHYLQEKLPEFKAAGAQLIALTPEVPDSSLSTSEKHELQFDVLSDLGNKVAREYGIVFDLTPEVAEMYQNSFNIEKYSGDASYQLPLAATYIIDRTGEIRYAFLDVDYRNRAEPDEIIKVLKLIGE